MAIEQFRITNSAWTAITTAGYKGTAWLERVEGGTKGRCRIWHGTTAPDSSQIKQGFPMDWTDDNTDTVTLVPDDSSDVYYAIADSADVSFLLTVDATI